MKSKVERVKAHSLLEHLSSSCEDLGLVPRTKEKRKGMREWGGQREAKGREERKLYLQGKAPETQYPCAWNHS